MRDELSGVAAAVVHQALEDARPGGATKDTDRATAGHFLFGASRGWVDSRRRWFALAGLHEPSREALRRAVEGPSPRQAHAAVTRLEKALDRPNRGVGTCRETAAA